ncbi:MAG: DUF3089 domain-containing protein [Prevotella sp.]|nr:DUF3089 domain-containing protein [Prevotella sp.]
MRNLKKWMLAAILICGTATMFISCAANEDNPAPVPQPDINLAEKIVGKWMVAELDGEACPTNLKAVVTFDSPTKASGSLSDFYSKSWNDEVEADVKIDGNKMIITAKEDDHTTHVLNVTVSSITDEDMVLSSEWTVLVDGKEAHKEVYEEERWERVTKDYEAAFLGEWEGKVTRDLGDETNDELHRWECNPDGTYSFFDLVDDKWVEAPHYLADYFVDGTLLCTRWQDTKDSEELREWWEIESIKDDVFKATALRVREDGSTYTATLQMTRVQPETAIDYSDKVNWLSYPEITKDVDAIYIYSTSYTDMSFEDGASNYVPIDNPEMILLALGEYETNATVFEESCNVFVPWYRQAGMKYANEVAKKTGNIDAALAGLSYTDIKAALDYYFENCNNGRPFIIAGHSQGSAMVRYVLKNYFKEHQDYYQRMVAAYPIGFSITKDDLEAYPYLKFATGESDTGVIITYNTEGPKNVEENARNVVVLPGAISINPLNWKLDETYASASENKGSLVNNKETGAREFVDLGVDAQINLACGVIVTNTTAPVTEGAEFFGPASFHENDYSFFYKNLQENVAKRVAAYMAK